MRLAALLAFIAGAVDVSGFLAFRQFTSHMTGTTAGVVIAAGSQQSRVLIQGLALVLSFVAGATICAVLVNYSRRRGLESLYAFPLLLEAVLLGCVSFVGGSSHASALANLLAFTMGLQNAVITKISDAEIRTTHLTGMMTDIGIEVGRALYPNRNRTIEPVRLRSQHLKTLSLLVASFVAGGLIAAFAFPGFGFHLFWPFASLLALVTLSPITSDLQGSHSRL